MMRQARAIFRKNSEPIGNSAHAHQRRRPEPALHGAEAELPMFCSVDDFFLIKLRHLQAGPISILQ